MSTVCEAEKPPRSNGEKFLQTAAVALFYSFNAISWLVLIQLLMHQYLMPIVAVYLLWLFFIDWNRPKTGGRKWEAVRNSSFFKYFAGYFPVKLIAEEALDPRDAHLIVYHPHGVIGVGCVSSFGSNAVGLPTVFPGLNVHLTTLGMLLKTPFYRELLLWMGFIDVSRESIGYCLDRGDTVALVLGGAEEALDSHPGTYDIILKKRHGFIKLALKKGANLVPCIGFGETDLWRQAPNPRGSFIRKVQVFLMKYCQFSAPLLYHLMPKRKPITVIVGKKIKVSRVDNPTEEQIRQLHEEYTKALVELFGRHKKQYAHNRKRSLQIVA